MGYAEKCRDDFTDKIEHSYTFIERREWVNRRSWPRKTIGHRGLSSIFRSLAIRSRLPLGTFVGNVTIGFVSFRPPCGAAPRSLGVAGRVRAKQVPDARCRFVSRGAPVL